MGAPMEPRVGAADTRIEAPLAPRDEDRALGQLIGDVANDLSTLVRKEFELARIELRDEARKAGRAGAMFGATALAAYLALLLASFAAAWGLAEVMPTGWAFLIVAVVYGIVAAVLYSRARREMRTVNPVPQQTVQTVKEDVQWAKQQTR